MIALAYPLTLALFAGSLASSPLPDRVGDFTPNVLWVEFSGPTVGGSVRVEGRKTVVEVQLSAGEAQRIRVPFSGLSEDYELAEVDFEAGSGSARALEWSASDRKERWSQLPAGLRGRTIPALEGVRSRPTPLAWAILASGLLLAGVFRSKPRVSAGSGLAAAALLLALPVVERVGSSAATVLEGEARSGLWTRVTVESGSAEVDLDRLLRLGAVPADGELYWKVAVKADGKTSWRAETLADRGGRLITCELGVNPFASPELSVAELVPAASSFRAVWFRPARSGAPLEARGYWELGAPLPISIRPGELAPPGWLVAGLPSGTGVLLGQLEDQGGPGDWVRLSGF